MTTPADPAAAPAAAAVPASEGCCRRQLLRGAAAVGLAGVGVVALSACSAGAPAPKGPVTLGAATDVPVGGGKLYSAQQCVVTQPTAGTYKAFSAVCTHAGCLVDGVSNGVISCPCHGSEFKTTDGSVVQGPASAPLPSIPLAVTNGKLVATFS
ncbi:Rieske (2Fe-2S) protein [Streptacidiphilus fuscans]|uniref:Cytochrome bc1 complex Rieske iron-sulfur subunit n=1 Tax=Streptacidiphilus fuscans TaxID=2789292 RepID=A0A931B6T4_9ACTN|nr:Rieske (2Fe-2S) protein [Streptacidiphilus fuscans]